MKADFVLWGLLTASLGIALTASVGIRHDGLAQAQVQCRNAALDFAADYLNALGPGPGRRLSAFDAASAVRALKDPGDQTPKEEWCENHVCPICAECDCE